MCTMGQCHKLLGQWVHFRTPWGYHRGVIEAVNPRAVLVRMPRQYAPALVSAPMTDEQKLDVALANWGYRGPYGPGWGYPGWGGWWAGWWWWWLAFAWIWALAALWW